VFQVKYMSLIGNWTKKTESNLTVLAKDRSTPAIVRLVNVRQALRTIAQTYERAHSGFT
jgi:hypothetical protein